MGLQAQQYLLVENDSLRPPRGLVRWGGGAGSTRLTMAIDIASAGFGSGGREWVSRCPRATVACRRRAEWAAEPFHSGVRCLRGLRPAGAFLPRQHGGALPLPESLTAGQVEGTSLTAVASTTASAAGGLSALFPLIS